MLVFAGFGQALPESQTSTMKPASVTGLRTETRPRLHLPVSPTAAGTLRHSFHRRGAGCRETPLPGEIADRFGKSACSRQGGSRSLTDIRASVVIGSDQVALFGREVIGKPGNPERCIEQLKMLSGQRLAFHTAVNVIHSDTGSNQSHLDITTVQFRKLTNEEIERYVARERPVNCAGGFKAEALGITLFDRIESQDPTALIGLPLIWLSGALAATPVSRCPR